MNTEEIKKQIDWFNKCEKCMTFMVVHGLMRQSERQRIQKNIRKMYDDITKAEVTNETTKQ